MNNCREVQKNISAYIDKETEPSSSRLIDGHLRDCPTCRKIFENFQEIDIMLKRLPADLPSQDFAGQVIKKLRTSVSPEKSSGKFKSLIRLFEEFFELLESKAVYHKSLDEFSDYPPFSMSHIYFNLYPTK